MSKSTIAVIGGKLQGTEAAYLARKAGLRVVLVDVRSRVPARGLCDSFVQADVLQKGFLSDLSREAEFIIPALENEQTLDGLQEAAGNLDCPIAFDFEAYQTTSSKKASNRLFAALDLPYPAPWPDCGFPVLAKPVSASGSSGVRIFKTRQELDRRFHAEAGEQWVLQEYVPGPSYSLEVLGCKGKFVSLAVTDLDMDEQHDCCRVTAPTLLDPGLTEAFRSVSEKIAAALALTGVMDVEVIAGPAGLRLLEIDARLPSQTPTAVYWSTGVNMVALLAEIYCFENLKTPDLKTKQAVVYEHILVTPRGPETKGEHIMSQAGQLSLIRDFFGTDEAITDYDLGKDNWAATLIIAGKDLRAARAKRDRVLEKIRLYTEE
ncbi:MAG: 3-methylornithine--L-lysine ligase PylC [Desulfohalobiaceae bacterium]|nr:3-methylornithine--L-lysine ligase PylC [Desulfohalobiaceae bacterium]